VSNNRDNLHHYGFFLSMFLLGGLIFALTGCAAMAPFLGLETVEGTDAKVKAIHAALDVAGPWGSVLATAIGAVLVGTNHAYRNRTRKKALAAKSR
jgi:branched-subunit amino acid ABC-type transport system permease component